MIKVIDNFGVVNQYILEELKNNYATFYFQSYNSLCAKYNSYTRTLTLYQDFDYSNTTSKYFHLFLNNYTYNGDNLYNFIKKHDIRKEKKLEYQNIKIEFTTKLY